MKDCVEHFAALDLISIGTGLASASTWCGDQCFVFQCLFIPQVLYEGFLELGCGGRAKASQMAQFMFGGLAGTLCWLSVLPFDVIKSRMQAIDGRHYTSLVHCALDSYNKEGAKVFMRGGLAMALRAFPVNGVTFLVYEVLLDLCQNR